MTATFFKSLILLQLGTLPFGMRKIHTRVLCVYVQRVFLGIALAPPVLLPAATFLNRQKRLFFTISAFVENLHKNKTKSIGPELTRDDFQFLQQLHKA